MAATSQSIESRNEQQTTRSLSVEEQQRLSEKMPASVKGFKTALGRTFECPECGTPSNASCDDCGYTHPSHRGGGR